MKSILMASLLAFSYSATARVIQLTDQLTERSGINHQEIKARGAVIHDIQFNINRIEALSQPGHPEFSYLTEENISFSKNLGQARLPFKSVVVQGKPEEIDVVIDEQTPMTLSLLSSPGQAEDCRCEVKKQKWISLNVSSEDLTKVEYLGRYRGKDLSRVTVFAATADLSRNETVFYPNLKAQITAPASVNDLYNAEMDANYDYLIVTPRSLLDGVRDFVAYKTAKGLRVKTEVLENIGSTPAQIKAFFKSEYDANNYKYALIVGTDDLVPNHKVSTSGSSQTPSDYPYFLMDSNDMIPDVQAGRVVATTVAEVARQANKWMNYEDHQSPAGQYLRMIGIASNEGSSPSDNEYVTGIEKDLNAAYGTTASHFYQNDATSKPQFINEAMNRGTAFLVYLGHGSGTSWASTGTYYTTANIKQLNNAAALKPVIIDVACQNGILKKSYLGETFMNATNAQSEAIGASMYYGGSVNISWHPPAIMARGLVKRTIANNLNKVGDAILAGHLYLIENHTEIEEVRDNFEWYHLFGEPSAPIYFQ